LTVIHVKMCKRRREKLTTRDRSSGCRPAKKTFPYPGNRPPLLATRDNPAEKGEIIFNTDITDIASIIQNQPQSILQQLNVFLKPL
jgi:hypothetical protein